MVTNSKRGEEKVILGAGDEAKTFTIKLDFNALCLLEEMHGRSVMETFSAQRLGIRTIRDGLFVGLVANDSDLTPAKLGDLMSETPERIGEWATAIRKALISAMGERATVSTPEAKDAAPLAPSGTGSTSTN